MDDSTAINLATTKRWDLIGLIVSLACLVHCLALPLLFAALPLLGSYSENSAVHKLLVLVALPIGLWALIDKRLTDGAAFTRGALSIGLLLLLTGAFAEALSAYEEPLTIGGALSLAFGHFWRWKHRRGRCETHMDSPDRLR